MNRSQISAIFSVLFLLASGCSSDDGTPSNDAGEAVDEAGNPITICTPTPSTMPTDPCNYHITRTPDATLLMSISDTEDHVEVAAPIPPPFTGFPQQPSCPAKVVEVHVPAYSTPSAADCGANGQNCYDFIQMAAGSGPFGSSTTESDFDYFRIPVNLAACEDYSLWVRLYKRASGESNFTFVKRYSYHGVWKGGICSIETTCGVCDSPSCVKSYFPNVLTAPTPPASGTDVYRIVTASRAFNGYTASRVKAMYRPLD